MRKPKQIANVEASNVEASNVETPIVSDVATETPATENNVPETPIVSDVPETPATESAVIPAALPAGFSLRNFVRTASTIAAQRTNYGTTSDRDGAYCALYLTVRDANGEAPVTLAAIAAHCKALQPNANKPRNYFYSGPSAKPHDAGVANRCRNGGYITISPDGTTITLTASGEHLAKLTLANLAR
jgi:hypothetical protein